MLPKMIEVMVEQLAEENKVLVDYKLYGGKSPMATIVLKFGDLDHIDLLHLGDPMEKKPYWSRPGYRTPSQLYRDNSRTQKHMFDRSSRPSDSGVDTFAMGYGEGAFCSSMSQGVDSRNHPTYGYSTRFFEDIHASQEDITAPQGNMKNNCVDAEVQCEDIIEHADAETSFQCDQVEIFSIATQCDQQRSGVADIETQCGAGLVMQRDIGIGCKVKVDLFSKRVQTKSCKLSSIGVSCVKSTQDNCAQTDNKVKLMGGLNSKGCQTSVQTVGRHVQASPLTNNTKTQTLRNNVPPFDGAAKTPEPPGKSHDKSSVYKYINTADSRNTSREEYAKLVGDKSRNRTVHHIVHSTDHPHGKELEDTVWFMFDDLAVCYTEAAGQLQYSHYRKFIGNFWCTHYPACAKTTSYAITLADPRYLVYKNQAESYIGTLMESMWEIDPT